jgi:hypothetical protein
MIENAASEPRQIAVVNVRDGANRKDVPVWTAGGAIYYRGRMTIDLDGAPNAYHPPTPSAPHGKGPGLGLDDLRNATRNLDDGPNAVWVGIVTDDQGKPVVQTSGPFAGFFVSTTSLEDHRFNQTDSRRYVDATRVPYVVLNLLLRDLASDAPALGDLAVVLAPGPPLRTVYGILADIGPRHELGECSLALARELGIPNGTAKEQIDYVFFPGSGDGSLKSNDEIAQRGEELFRKWGGLARITSIRNSDPSP